LEVQFEAERDEAQKNWQATIERITELTKKSSEIDGLQLRCMHARQEIDVANAVLEKTITDFRALEKEREAVYLKCTELSESMESATRGELLHLRSVSLDSQEKALERRHFKMEEFAKNLARMQARAKALTGANELTEALIKKANDQIETAMSEIEFEMSELDVFNMPSKVQD
jgi:uncharacterized protein (DUF3084 family)